MTTEKYAAFIECGIENETSPFLSANTVNEYKIKKVFFKDNAQHNLINSQFPHLEIVNSFNHLIEDANIDLIIVSNADEDDKSVIGAALTAGKNVRILE